MKTQGTAAVRLVQKLVRGITVIGKIDPPSLLRAAGIAPEQLFDSDGRMPHAAVQALWREAERLTGDDTLGLRVAELSRRTPDNVLAYAVDSSPTVGEALRRGARYTTLVHDCAQAFLIPDGNLVRSRVVMNHPLGLLRHGADFSLGQMAMVIHQLAATPVTLCEARFRHTAPRSLEVHERMFRAPLHFEAEHDEVVFERAVLDVPLNRPDPELCSHLDRLLDQLLSRHRAPSDLVRKLRAVVGSDLRGGLPEIQSVAARLHMSTRSLQRRLRESGSSFQDELNMLRRDLAVGYLGDPSLAIAEVAFLVGFAEVTNFHRAFKRWTKMTPAECRKQRANAPGALSA
jgi:AraC-like DNA-binding protein